MRASLQPKDGDLSRRSLLAGAVGILVLPLAGGVAELPAAAISGSGPDDG